MINLAKKYKTKIANTFGFKPDQVYLYGNGRTAFWAILKSLDLNEGDEVALPSITCSGLVQVVESLNLKPLFLEVDNNLTIPRQEFESKLNQKTRVLMIQHTFNIIQDFSFISKKNYPKLITIENCSQGHSSIFKPNTISRFIFYSTQWNKVYSTGEGGVAISKNFQKLESKKSSMLSEIIFLFPVCIALFIRKLKAYWFLKSLNPLFKSITNQHNFKSEDYKLLSCLLGILELKKYTKNIEHRNKITKEYMKNFDQDFSGFNDYLLYYPFVTSKKSSLLCSAKKKSLEIYDWPIEPLSPPVNKFERYYTHSSLKISNSIIGLPTNSLTDLKAAHKIIKFIST